MKKLMTITKSVLGATLVVVSSGCDNISAAQISSEKIAQDGLHAFIESVMQDLVFVQGGEFLMGDFGPEHSPERLPYDSDEDSKPLHKVTLTSFSIDKFKVTNERYQFYLAFNNISPRDKGVARQSDWDSLNAVPDTPAHVDWYEAEKYCQWLGTVTKQNFSLPTEAQWEYAARSRGQYLMVATDEGDYKAEPLSVRTESHVPLGINISSDGNRLDFARARGLKADGFTPLPVDMFPPNPLGVYSMADNGYEWVSDWYDPDYYNQSPAVDPRGPERPVFKDKLGHKTKVLRGQSFADPYWGGGVNVFRTAMDPLGRRNKRGSVFIGDNTMRCVVNSPEPITAGSPSK